MDLVGPTWSDQTLKICPGEHPVNFPNLVYTITPGDANTLTQAKRTV